ncbi:hypothetical protein ACGC1H_003727 [Rhizoctonia solani]
MNVGMPQLERSGPVNTPLELGNTNEEKSQIEQVPVEVEHHIESEPLAKARPPLDYSSFGSFWTSVIVRLGSVLTRRFLLAFFGGQLVSICVTSTSVAITELVKRGWSLPATQNFFLYFALFSIYTPFTIYEYGFKGWGNLIRKDGWKYLILAVGDVEGNYMVVLSYQHTNLLSCILLNAWAIPVCAFFSWIYMKPKYHWTQLTGIMICIAGLGMLVASDHLTRSGFTTASSMLKGDLLMIAGATLYGFNNATKEFLVRRRPLYEMLGQVGMYAMIIDGIQASALEHDAMRNATWNGGVIGLIFAFTLGLFIFYIVTPLIFRAASSVYMSLSILSSDFYGLLFGLGLYKFRPYFLYFIAFGVIILGLLTYFWHTTPEAQGEVDPQKPDYVLRRESERGPGQDLERQKE